eukprot:gene10712-22368_t
MRSITSIIRHSSRAYSNIGITMEKRLNRAFSSAASAVSIESKDDIKNLVGPVYHELLHRGRQKNRLALGDLRKLIQLCDDAETIKYAVLGIELYQRKGQDFSEEACIRANEPMKAASMFLKYENRISAWTTKTAMNRLSESLLAQGEASTVFDVLVMLMDKGFRPDTACIETAIKATVAKGDLVMFQQVEQIAKRFISEADLAEVLSRYEPPSPAPTPDPATDPVVAADENQVQDPAVEASESSVKS